MAAIYLLFLIVHITYGQIIDGCTVTYTEEPPTALRCNPYVTHVDPPQIFTRYGCRADSPVPLDDFMITWFRQTLNGTVKELPCSVRHINTPKLQRCLLDILGETEPASYWCVASYTVDGNRQVLERSNIGIIESDSAYVGLARCSGTKSQAVATCADVSASGGTESATDEVFTNGQEMQTSFPAQTNTPKATNIYVEVIEKTTPTSSKDANTPLRSATANTVLLAPTTTKARSPSATASRQDQQTFSPATSMAGSSMVRSSSPQATVNSLLSSEAIAISLLAICVLLLIGLLVTITLMVVIVILFRRKIRKIRKSEMEVTFKASSRTRDLEGSTGTMNDKYVYPLTAGIYSVPSREETVKSTRSDQSGNRSSNDSRSSQQSYQSLLCTNMEYTSIYTTPNLMKLNSSSNETQSTNEV